MSVDIKVADTRERKMSKTINTPRNITFGEEMNSKECNGSSCVKIYSDLKVHFNGGMSHLGSHR